MDLKNENKENEQIINQNRSVKENENESEKEKELDKIKGILEALKTKLDIDYKEEQGNDGTITLLVYKDNNLIASFNANGQQFFDARFQNDFEEAKRILDKVKVKDEKIDEEMEKIANLEEIENNNEENKKVQNNDEKNKDKKDNKKEKEQSNEITKESIEEEFGDQYIVSAEINDDEISRKIIETEGFCGNPFVTLNKETKEFVLLGSKGGGKLEEAKLHRTSTVVNVDKYNYDGSIVTQRSINGMVLLPPENKDGLDLRVNEYGEIEVNKIVNARGENPQMFPVDTKQKVPSSQEISDMKKDEKGMEEINEILDEMQEKDIIEESERTEILEDLSTNGDSLEEDKEKLNKIIDEKENKGEKKPESDTYGDDDDEYDPRDPRYNDPRWN